MSATSAGRPTIEAPRRVGACWLVPVAITCARSLGAHAVYLSKTPTALLFVAADGVRAFRIDGSPCDARELLAELPELATVLATLPATPT